MQLIADDAAPQAALSAEEFHALMTKFDLPVGGRLALAVSGGPDSMAMAVLARDFCAARGLLPPVALIVDHALRAESAEEAAIVRTRLAELEIEGEILRWAHAPIMSRLHSEARKGRYGLLIEACRARGIEFLLTAHQREDQAETILMRFAKGTGIDGLAGIAASAEMDGIRVLRPLLSVPKERLIATCVAAGVSFVSDPSNHGGKFARGRLRRVMPLLAEEGLSVERLVDFGLRAGEAREALDFYTNRFLADAARRDQCGVISIEKEKLLAVPRAIALRALAATLQAVHADDYDPAHAALSLLFDALRAGDRPPRTLHGCLVSESKQSVTIMRELSAITDILPIRGGETVLWDGRWMVSLTAGEPACEVRALGHPPHDVLDRLAPKLRHDVPQGRVRSVLPALWRGGEIIAIPYAGGVARAEISSPCFGKLHS